MKEKLIKTGAFIDNEYFDLYCELIEKNLHTKKEKYKTQAHHIVPRYTKLNIEDKVNLSHKDHCFAHYYLCFCSSNDKYKFANENALIHIIKCSFNKLTEKEINDYFDKYNEIMIDRNKRMSLKFKGKKRSSETITKMSLSLKGCKSHNKGKHLSDETKRKISEKLKGKVTYIRTEEHKKMMSEKFKGHIVSKETKLKISNTLKSKR